MSQQRKKREQFYGGRDLEGLAEPPPNPEPTGFRRRMFLKGMLATGAATRWW